MVKQTMAILGMERNRGSVMVGKIAARNRYRLLLVVKHDQHANFPENTASGNADTEIIDCLRDGCWEADIILVDLPLTAAAEVAGNIREVATQKILFIFSADDRDIKAAFRSGSVWQSLLPNVKVVTGFTEDEQQEIFFSGEDQEAVQTVAALMDELGYQTAMLYNKK